MVGSAFTVNGGMTTVTRSILDSDANVQWRYVPTYRETGPAGKIVTFLIGLVRLYLVLLRFRPNVAHLHVSTRGSVVRKSIVAQICRWSGVPVVLHCHGSDFHEYYRQLPRRQQARVQGFFTRASRLIVLSESWRNFFLSEVGLDPNTVTVLHNPVVLPSKSLLRKKSTSAEFRIVFLGRIGERKGAFTLLEALRLLVDAVPDRPVRLDMAGDGELARAKALISDLGLMANVVLHPWLSPPDRDALLQEADAFVLASQNEGLPMALLEAMSWALPVITTPVGGIPEVVRPDVSGILVNPDEPDEIAQALQDLWQNPALRVTLGSGAREVVEGFTLSLYARRLESLYQDVTMKDDGDAQVITTTTN